MAITGPPSLCIPAPLGEANPYPKKPLMNPGDRSKIALVNMPFSAVATPSIGLTQLKAVVEKEFPGRFEITSEFSGVCRVLEGRGRRGM